MELRYSNLMDFLTASPNGAHIKGIKTMQSSTALSLSLEEEFPALHKLASISDEPQPVEDDFADLEDLLASAKQERSERDKGRELRSKLAKSGNTLSKQETSEIEAAIAKWEAERVWKPEATVAVLEIATCGCGVTVASLQQFLQLQSLRSKPDTKRYTRVPVPDLALPRISREVRVERLCLACLWASGFSLTGPDFEAPLARFE